MSKGPLSQEAAELHSTHPARDAERSTQTLENEVNEPAGKPEAPIGVFDSGAGGLSVLAALREELPYETYIYYGDTAHIPYGMRSDDDITALTTRACRFLVEQGTKLIVIACNTASQAALSTLRATFSLPFVGVVPAVKPAARATRKGRVGIAATNQAAKAQYLRQLIDQFAEGISVYAAGYPELVTLVERGELDGPETERIVREALEPMLAHDVDVIVLGCTHFPVLRRVIERVAGSGVQIIDSGSAVARHTRHVLEAGAMLAPVDDAATPGMDRRLQVWCSGDPRVFSEVATKILGYPVTAHQHT